MSGRVHTKFEIALSFFFNSARAKIKTDERADTALTNSV